MVKYIRLECGITEAFNEFSFGHFLRGTFFRKLVLRRKTLAWNLQRMYCVIDERGSDTKATLYAFEVKLLMYVSDRVNYIALRSLKFV